MGDTLRVTKGSTSTTSAVVIRDDTWHHISIVYRREAVPMTNSKMYQVYIDGQSDVTLHMDDDDQQIQRVVYGPSGSPFVGWLHDFRLCNGAIEPVRVRALAHQPSKYFRNDWWFADLTYSQCRRFTIAFLKIHSVMQLDTVMPGEWTCARLKLFLNSVDRNCGNLLVQSRKLFLLMAVDLNPGCICPAVLWRMTFRKNRIKAPLCVVFKVRLSALDDVLDMHAHSL